MNINQILIPFLEWKEQQHKTIRGGEVMYDIKGYHKYIFECDLFGYWTNHIFTNDVS